jgi:hypothetical protein
MGRGNNSSNSRGPEVKKAQTPLEQMKIEIATELGIPNYDSLNKGDLPARVHGKIGGNMVRRMITNYEAIMSNPTNAALISQSNPVADTQLAQDKQIIKSRYGSIINKESSEASDPQAINSGDANAQTAMMNETPNAPLQ